MTRRRAVLEAHRALIALRRRNPWLHRAHTDVVHVDNGSLVIRTATDAAAVVTALNLGAPPLELPSAGATSVEAGDAELHGDRMTLGPGGWAVLTG